MKLPIGLSALVLLACSSSGTGQDTGLTGDGVGGESAAPDSNPDGVPYPSTNIGTLARRGTTPGNTIQNFKFLGYPDANSANGLTPISLAQFYDPSGERYSVIHIQAAGVWCSACKAETTALVPLKAELATRKAVWLVSLAEGPVAGKPSKVGDLDGWIAEFHSPFTHVLDPSNHNLGPFYDSAALPWNANIDARTMEILTAGTGGAVTGDRILAEIDEAIALAGTK